MGKHRSSRREFLKYGSVLGFSSLLSGCRTVEESEVATPTRTSNTNRSETEAPTETEPDVVTVERGETFLKHLRSGDTLTNTIIDISAPGATFDVDASGQGWEIRGVGIRGTWDVSADAEPLSVAVTPGGTATIESLYFADGVTDDTYPGVTGIYVKRRHAGSLAIHRTNIQRMSDNAIYASTPGYPADNAHDLPEGGGGEVTITNSYAADCLASHYRIGTTGSSVRNCVAVGGDRGLWARFQTSNAVNCDFSGGNREDVGVGSPHWPKSREASAALEECRYETSTRYWDDNSVIGESAGDPRTEPPDGVPTSAEAAADGRP